MAVKLSISNIAWPYAEEEFFLKHIRNWGCSGVEIAPSRIWPEPAESSRKERRLYKSSVLKYDLEITALQALLYNRPDLGLFRSSEIESKTIEYLKRLCQLASDLEAQILVFGSPANRKRGNILLKEAFERAAIFFSKIAPTAKNLGIYLCIEPLRPQETDFITTSYEGLRLVEMVNIIGFGLHLDGKAVVEEGGNLINKFKTAMPKLKHFHINDPNLIEVNRTGLVDHFSLGEALRKAGYDRYVSIEMRTTPDHYNVIQRSLAFSTKAYIDLNPVL